MLYFSPSNGYYYVKKEHCTNRMYDIRFQFWFISIKIDRNDLNKLLTDHIALNSFHFTQQCISQKTNKSFNLLGQNQNSLCIMFEFCIATCNRYLKCNNLINIDTEHDFNGICSYQEWQLYGMAFVCLFVCACADVCFN